MHNARYQEAIRGIEKLLSPLIGIRRLNKGEIAFYGSPFSEGWEIPGLCERSEHKLRILLPSTAPFAPSRIAVWPVPPSLAWPHVEEKGLLCLMSETDTYSIEDCAGVTQYLLTDAIILLNDCVSEANFGDFEDEFQSYWRRWDAAKNNCIYVHCLPVGPSRWVSSLHNRDYLRVADSETELLDWMDHRYGKDVKSKVRPQNVPLIWLPRPLRPKEYPNNVKMLSSILNEMEVDDSMLKRLLVDQQLKHHSVVLGFKGRQGVGFAGLFIGNSVIPLRRGGFTKNPPDNLILMRYGGAKIRGAQAIRLDSSWVHGRDHNPQERNLSEKSVVILGIGSLGSSLAPLLAMSGVGELILVDPERLSSENSGRHVLGVDSIGMNKAIKLASDLSTRFPHLKIHGYDMTCQTFYATTLPTIRKPNLIISTIGDWRQDGWLNAMSVDSFIQSPILYGWSEPHAAAGHAVIFQNGQGCLRCLRDILGRVNVPVTSWPEDGTLVPVPACGGFFQPYGAIEISHIHGLIADLALDVLLDNTITSAHRVWIGSNKIIKTTGGIWNPLWIAKHGDPGSGGCIQDIEVLPDTDCPECCSHK